MKKLALGPIVALVAALALCASAAPALAANHTITLTGPPSASVGQPMAIRASGVVAPPEEFWDLSWIEVVEISMKVVTECPPDASSAGVLAEETGGNILAIALRPYMDEAGSYTNLVGYTPPAQAAVPVRALARRAGVPPLSTSVRPGSAAPVSASSATPAAGRMPVAPSATAGCSTAG